MPDLPFERSRISLMMASGWLADRAVSMSVDELVGVCLVSVSCGES